MIGGKYCKEREIDPKPVIFICNQLPTPRGKGEFDWWIGNTFRYFVDTPLY
jgi:hypothetical protein